MEEKQYLDKETEAKTNELLEERNFLVNQLNGRGSTADKTLRTASEVHPNEDKTVERVIHDPHGYKTNDQIDVRLKEIGMELTNLFKGKK